MRVLVTGANGFVGRHLITALSHKKHRVFAGVRRVDAHGLEEQAETYKLDITDYENVKNTIGEIRPDGIIHLAAQSMVQQSWKDPAATVSTNVIGTIQLIKAVKEKAPQCKLITIGTSEEYGLTGKLGQPLEEQAACLPQNPYAISKLAAGQLALQLSKKENLKLLHVRPFNHFGPGQQTGFVISDFASQIARIEKGLSSPTIFVGDLSAKRDFLDVRDVVNAYVMLLEHHLPNDIYNICSGVPRTIEDILRMLIQKAKADIRVAVDPSRFRPSEVPLFFGSSHKIQQAIAWRPARSFEDSLAETLEWWRKQDLHVKES